MYSTHSTPSHIAQSPRRRSSERSRQQTPLTSNLNTMSALDQTACSPPFRRSSMSEMRQRQLLRPLSLSPRPLSHSRVSPSQLHLSLSLSLSPHSLSHAVLFCFCVLLSLRTTAASTLVEKSLTPEIGMLLTAYCLRVLTSAMYPFLHSHSNLLYSLFRLFFCSLNYVFDTFCLQKFVLFGTQNGKLF